MTSLCGDCSVAHNYSSGCVAVDVAGRGLYGGTRDLFFPFNYVVGSRYTGPQVLGLTQTGSFFP